MSVKIVTYDLRPSGNYTDLIKAIKIYENAKLTESFWLIKTDDSNEDIYKNLDSYLDSNDRLLIINLDNKQMIGKNIITDEETVEKLFEN